MLSKFYSMSISMIIVGDQEFPCLCWKLANDRSKYSGLGCLIHLRNCKGVDLPLLKVSRSNKGIDI